MQLEGEDPDAVGEEEAEARPPEEEEGGRDAPAGRSNAGAGIRLRDA